MIRVQIIDGHSVELMRRQMPAAPRNGEVVNLWHDPDPHGEDLSGTVEWVEWILHDGAEFDLVVGLTEPIAECAESRKILGLTDPKVQP